MNLFSGVPSGCAFIFAPGSIRKGGGGLMMSERPLFSNADAVPAGKLNFARLFSSIVLAVALPALLLPFVSLSLEGDAVQSISGYDVLFRDASWFESVHIEREDQ